MPERRHPSLLVVFKRSRTWKNGTGDVVFVWGFSGSVDNTFQICQYILNHKRCSRIIYLYLESRYRYSPRERTWPSCRRLAGEVVAGGGIGFKAIDNYLKQTEQ
jgi:hypothetical protein